MKKILLLVLAGSLISFISSAQYSRYIVRFKNKGGNPFSLSTPSAYLSQRAIDRRSRFGIPVDSADLPVTPAYISQVDNIPNVTILNVSKWLNGVSIQTSDPAAITAINNLSFVQSVNSAAARPGTGQGKFIEGSSNYSPGLYQPDQINSDFYNYGTSAYNEIRLHRGEFLHNIGLRGQTMQIALLDAGFFNYTTLDALDSIIANGQVLSTWDFVSGHASVTEDHTHGMQCLSTIAANLPGQFVGKAPKANFHLFRTEDIATEYPIEEFNWVCGAERADSTGADVISSSLGYSDFDGTDFDYTYADMDGNTTISAQGADIAARKGLLVFNSVGNDGNGAWHFLITPSDGDSVVAVGAVNAAGQLGGYSSWGPSSDGQVKPDVLSVGTSAIVQNANNTIGFNTGTSFACPNMAGLTTCLWQGFPEFNNMKIIRALQKAGSFSANPQAQAGYGIPNMKTAFSNLLVEYAGSTASINQCTVTLSWNSKDVAAMKYEIERKGPADVNFIKIGELAPLPGNILANHSYQFLNTLANIPDGIVSYRIRQIIDTNSASFTAVYIDTSEVTAAGCTNLVVNPQPGSDFVTVFPNPASSSQVNLIVETTYPVAVLNIIIYDMQGRKLQSLKKSKAPGQELFELSINKLQPGLYVILALDNERRLGTAELIRQ